MIEEGKLETLSIPDSNTIPIPMKKMRLNVTVKRPNAWIIRSETQRRPAKRLNRNRVFHYLIDPIIPFRILWLIKLPFSIR